MSDKPVTGRAAVDYLIASKKSEIHNLEHLLRTGRLVVAISNLVHALQRERGASSMFLGSNGERSGDIRLGLVEESRTRECELRERLADLDIQEPCLQSAGRLFNRVAYVVHGLEQLDKVRERIAALELTPQVVITGYGRLIRGLLQVVFEAADSAADPDVSRALVAMFNFMQGKEFAGQERALGAATFAGGGFDGPAVERLVQLIEAQERCFQSFVEFAAAVDAAAWQEVVAGPYGGEVERLRRIACASSCGGRAGSYLSDVWFDRTTRRIDAMKTVEDQLQQRLNGLCEAKITHAKRDLASHKARIAALSEPQADDAAGFAVFFSDGGPDTAALSADGVGPQLGRSIIGLVQSQSQRLQRMQEELNAARAALSERKTIEKAKGLIMQHHQLTEERAYTLLRDTAMRQGRRLADVAAATVALAEVLRRPAG